jgi:hypothetical protein
MLGVYFVKVKGFYQSKEDSYIVFNISVNELKFISKYFNQDSFIVGIRQEEDNNYYSGTGYYAPVLKLIAKSGDFQDLENFVFGFSENSDWVNIVKKNLKGFSGIKNWIHNDFRDSLNSQFQLSRYEAQFGDIELLIKMFGNL